MELSKRFVKITDVALDTVNASLYRSVFTGSKVIFVNKNIPTISAKFIISTKTLTEDGLPHCLEHLTFMGSKKYPYKGYLDSLANVTFAVGGTNATTWSDYTEYFVENVGHNGFLAMLIPYLDHLFNPLLLEEHFTTEIHHVDGEGNDGGVVYSELQADEGNPEELIDRQKRKLIYSEGHPFYFSAGGTVRAIRDLNIEKIREFHKEQYILPNLMIAIQGIVDKESVFQRLAEFENKMGYNEPMSEVINLFNNVVLPNQYEPKDYCVSFPSEESLGSVSIFFQGPPTLSDDALAVYILLEYYSEGSESALEKGLVECEPPKCSDIQCDQTEYGNLEFGFHFTGVPKYCARTPKKFRDDVIRIIKEDEIDMQRIKCLLSRAYRQHEYDCEGDVFDHLSTKFAVYKNYGNNVDTIHDDPALFKKTCSDVDIYKSLLNCPKGYWEEISKKYFNENAVVVSAIPKADLISKRNGSFDKFIQQRKHSIGEERLVQNGVKLKGAFESMELSVPPKKLVYESAVEMGNVNIHEPVRDCIKGLAKSPVIFHNVDSNFVTVKILINLSNIPLNDRKYMALYVDTITELDAMVNGEFVSHEEISTLLKDEFIDYDIRMGLGNAFSEYIVFTFVIYPGEYNKINKWMNAFLKNQIYENSRISFSCNRLVGNAMEMLYDGENILKALIINTITDSIYVGRYTHPIAGMEFYSKFQKNKKRSEILNQVAKSVADMPSNIHIFGKPENYKKNLEELQQYSFSRAESIVYNGINPYLVNIKKAVGKTVVISCNSGDSAYAKQMIPIKYGYFLEEHIYLMIFAQILSMTEGPLWKAIRGKGLAYGAYVIVVPGLKVEIDIYRASKLMEALTEAENIIQSALSEKTIDEVDFIAAKNSLIAEFIADVATPRSIVKTSCYDFLRGAKDSESYSRFALEVINKATIDDVINASYPIFEKLSDPTEYMRAIVVPSKDYTDMKIEKPEYEYTTIEKLGFINI